VPVRLFTDAERDRLTRFPPDVPPGDLLAWFTLSDDALDLIGDRGGEHNRLGFGLQLTTLPYLGFVPDDLTSASPCRPWRCARGIGDAHRLRHGCVSAQLNAAWRVVRPNRPGRRRLRAPAVWARFVGWSASAMLGS
jgi:hypothetical protein